MGIMRFNYRSQVLSGYVDISIVYPTDNISYYDMSEGVRGHHRDARTDYPVYKPGMKFQTVYLLHGGGDDDTLTYRYTNAELYAQRNCCMLVTPNIRNSFGINTAYGADYSTFLTEELPVVVQSLFASSPRREDNFIAGYAMGGNAALGTALLKPEMFAECYDMSGGIGWTVNLDSMKFLCGPNTHFKLFAGSFGDGDKLEGSHFDIKTIAQAALDSGKPLPKLHFLAGDKEGFIGDSVRADYEGITAMGFDTEWIGMEGAHDFALWDRALALLFDEWLPLKRKPIYE